MRISSEKLKISLFIGATTAFEISSIRFLVVELLLLWYVYPMVEALGAPGAKTARSRRNALPSERK